MHPVEPSWQLPHPRGPRPWQRHWSTQLFALILGVGPLYAMSIYSGYLSASSGEFQALGLADMLLQLGVMISIGIIIVGLLHVCGERLADLQLRHGMLLGDIGQGLLLFLGTLATIYALLYLLGERQQPEATRAIGEALAADPLLLAVWLGPMIWIQAGLIEELTRVFALTRLWHIWPQGRVVSLVAWSFIFGLAHLYQGTVGVLGTAVIALVLGAHYLRHGRVLPLIIAHGLYDTVVTLGLVYAARNPELLEKLQQAAPALLPALL